MSQKLLTILCIFATLAACEAMKPAYKDAHSPSCSPSDLSRSCKILVPFDTPLDKNRIPIPEKKENTKVLDLSKCEIENTDKGLLIKNCKN